MPRPATTRLAGGAAPLPAEASAARVGLRSMRSRRAITKRPPDQVAPARADDGEKGLLRQVLGPGSIAEAQREKAMDCVGVPLEQCIESAHVSLTQALHEHLGALSACLRRRR